MSARRPPPRSGSAPFPRHQGHAPAAGLPIQFFADGGGLDRARTQEGAQPFYQLPLGYGNFPPNAPLSARIFHAAQSQMTCKHRP
jgi:hypothetical protein